MQTRGRKGATPGEGRPLLVEECERPEGKPRGTEGGRAMNKTKRTIHHHQQREEKQDRISQLPDALLHHILSLLPLNSAARTSVLSKRWKDLWNSMWAYATCFDFDKRFWICGHRSEQVATINRYLQLHRGNTIEKFCLFIYPGVRYRSDIGRWIRFAAAKGVKELNLEFSFFDLHSSRRLRGPFKLPFPVLSCNALTILKLTKCHLHLPENFRGFPLLKALCLHNVEIRDNVLERMLLSCPTLEKLELKNVGFDRMKLSAPRLKISIHGLALKSLTLSNFVYNAYEIEIHTPGLLFFHLHGRVHCCFSSRNLSSLEEAIIDLSSPLRRDDWTYVLSKISHVKILTICGDTVLIYSRKLSNEAHRGLPVVYANLIELQLTVRCLDEDCLNAIYVLFKQCRFPSLEKLFIELQRIPREATIQPMGEEPAECVFTHLKAVKITCFHGWHTEMQLVKFLLERAVVLESLVLITVKDNANYCFAGGHPTSQTKSTKELLMAAHERLLLLPKASSNAHVVLCEDLKDNGSLHPTHMGPWSVKSLCH